MTMKNVEEARQLIDAITSAELYEGDFGHRISDAAAILSGVDGAERNNVPGDYLAFLAELGTGELDAAFYVDPAPVKYSDIVGKEVSEYKGMYVFSGNQSGVLYAFDSNNGWSVAEISSESDGFELVSESFSDFILGKLKYIKELVDWRAAH